MIKSSARREMWTMRREQTKRYSATKSLSATDCNDTAGYELSSTTLELIAAARGTRWSSKTRGRWSRKERAYLHRVSSDSSHSQLGTQQFTVNTKGVSCEGTRSQGQG